MSEHVSQTSASPTDQPADQASTESELADARGEHETDQDEGLVTDSEAPAEDSVSDDVASNSLPSADKPAVQDTLGASTEEESLDDIPNTTKPAVTEVNTTSMSVKPPAGKPNGGGPPTPLVKRIINSGTFGAGSVKPASSSKPAISSAATKPPPSTTPTLKKAPLAQSKTSMASSRTPGAPVAPPSRRASVVPAKPSAPPITKPTLSASANSKPSASGTASATRQSVVVSPTGSTASLKSASASKPRASVSEGVKRAPLASRQSLSTTTKPPATAPTSAKPLAARPSSATAAKPIRTTNSITSIREVKEDGKLLEDLQTKLKDAEDLLATKTDAVVGLTAQIGKLESSLQNALADVSSKALLTDELEAAKAALEDKLVESKNALESLQANHSHGSPTSRVLQDELDAAKAASATQSELIQTLQSQIQSLEAQISTSKENLDTLRSSHDSAISDAAASASLEQETLRQAKEDLAKIESETAGLKALHASALEEMSAKLTDFERRAARVSDLEAQISELKLEKEENAGKLSELEIEILELKESQESNEDERERSLVQSKSLEEALSAAAAATQQVIDESRVKEAEYLEHTAELQRLHEEKLGAASEEQAKLLASLDNFKAELATALAAQKQSEVDARATTENHARLLKEAEQNYHIKEADLSEEIKRITAELESQEARYDAKVSVVKAEHEKSLQEAFERAKNEAGDAHFQELQNLRAGSNATIEQIQAANKVALDDLQAEHALALESQVKGLEKQINTLNLDLRATQDDLVKAKAALESARTEIESLTLQRDEARTNASASLDPSTDNEVARLTKELSHTKDDLAAVTEMLDITKSSLTDFSNNHTRELEEAAKSRAEEVTKLRAAHDEEVTSLVTQKSELLVKLSDLEGELATVKASMGAETITPKGNGNGGVQHQVPGVTKEELQRMHEAHNLKMYDLAAGHEKVVKALKEELEASQIRADELHQEVGRKAMEIQYLEQDQDESQEQITRLKEDLETALNREHAASA